MKFLHIADLHLGKQVADFSMLEDQRFILREILSMIDFRHPDAVVVAGDLYDKPVPPADAVTLLDWFITELSEREIPLLIISGNHDSPERLEFGSGIFEQKGIYFAGRFQGAPKKVTLSAKEDPSDQADFYLLPFIRPANVRPFYPDEEIKSYDDAMRCVIRSLSLSEEYPSVLIAHQFVTAGGVSPERSDSEILSLGGTDNVDVSNFLPFQYVALGHIHRPQRLTRESVRYAGSPLKYSFSEAAYAKSAVFVTLRGMEEPEIELLPLTPLHDMRRIKGPLENLIREETVRAADPEDYLHVTLTDTEPVSDPMFRLRQVYPNIMRLEYEGNSSENIDSPEEEEVEHKTPPQLFADFYRQMMGKDLSEEDKALVLSLMDEVWAGERAQAAQDAQADAEENGKGEDEA